VPFTLHEQDKLKYAELSGIAVSCQVDTNHTAFNDAMLFTHRGLSGPAMLQISSYWTAGQALKITLEPSIDLYKILLEHKSSQPKLKLKNLLANYFPKKLVDNFLAEEGDLTLANLKDSKLSEIAGLFQAWLIKPNATEGYRTAEVTLGGVDCNELSSQTFEVKSVPNLYFIGEVLDVTGHLGGYNFQWAWASGHAAGNAIR